ncbi:MAG: TolC family protein [Bryobacterales bacterium]|nr:TolC family protein [Bryobacterales bacterium]
MRVLLLLLTALAANRICVAQQALPPGTSEVTITERTRSGWIGSVLRPFHIDPRSVTPIRVENSSRLENLIRGGSLYLTVQDVIALVLENNLDIAIQRYGPLLAREVLRRAEGGGFLRSIDTPVLPGPVSVSLAGVSVNTSGLAGGSGVAGGGGIVTQIGPTPPNLDPSMFAYASFGHASIPLSNTILSQTNALTNDSRQYQFGYRQEFLTGSALSLNFGTSRSKVNSPANLLNPSTTGFLNLYLTQDLLQGFSRAVNNRNIRVARNNLKVTDIQLKRQVSVTVAAVLAIYWDLVSFHEDVRLKHQSLARAQKLYDENRKRVEAGTLAPLEVTRSAAEVSRVKEDVLIAETNLAQQETVLKNALSRNGIVTEWLDEIRIVPLDRFAIPQKDEIAPLKELIQVALDNRPEIEQARTNLDSSKINLNGSRNALLPSLQAFADLTNNALSGPVNPLSNGSSGTPDPYFVGGYGNVLAQLARRNFPNYSIGFSLNIPLRNRVAQADHVIDQLQLRQSQLQLQRAQNQVRVEIKNAVIGLEQARSRYQTALEARELSEKALKAEQDRYQFGVNDINVVIQAERDLGSSQTAEVQAMANYMHARINFDEALGKTLHLYNITVEEAMGKVTRKSMLPDSLPEAPARGMRMEGQR